MIAFLRGKILEILNSSIILDVQGIGYEVFLTSNQMFDLEKNAEKEFFIYQIVKETDLILFGFDSLESRKFFGTLISVSGVGPKSALSILSLGEISTLKKNISEGNFAYVKQAIGIGPKTAKRIVIELAEKIELSDLEEDEVSLALKSLGFSDLEISNIKKKLSKDDPIEKQIGDALKFLQSE